MMLEDMHQAALFGWASAATVGDIAVGDYLLAIPNGGKRNKREALKLKRCGVKAGVSDLFLPVPRGTMHGLWIELKAPAHMGKPAGKPTKLQLDWLNRMGDQGYAAIICHGWEAAAQTITDYLSCDA